MPAVSLAEKVPAEQLDRVQEGIQMVGPTADAWLCDVCGGFGLMGDIEAG